MSNTQILSGPASTKRILANLSLAIDEAMPVWKIVSLSDEIRAINIYQNELIGFGLLRKIL